MRPIDKLLALCIACCVFSPQARAAAPRLTVVVVVDQLRGDEVTQFDPVWRAGMQRLRREGRTYTQGYHTHARTETAAGHATIGTGTLPKHHGIVDKTMYLAPTDRVLGVCDFGATPCAPDAALAPALGDRLKAQHPRAKVASFAAKARSATLMGGRRADVVAWHADDAPRLVGRTHGTPGLPPWLEHAYGEITAPARMPRVWELPQNLPAPFGERPDAAPGERGCGHGASFPHRLVDYPGTGATANYLAQWHCTPDSDRAVVATALAAARELALQEGEGPNLLWVSLAATDVVGHAFGYESLERAAVLSALDGHLGDLLDGLQSLAGESLLVALTADHGVAPKVANALAAGLSAGRVTEGDLRHHIDARLEQRFGPPPRGTYVALLQTPAVHLHDIDPGHIPEASRLAARALQESPYVHRAWSAAELVADTSDDAIAELMRASLHPERGGHVMFALQPRYSLADRTDGADHGSPWPYDRHVPVMLWGSGVTPGETSEEVAVIDLMRTVADRLGLPADPHGGRPLP